MRRVVITGLGITSCLGLDAKTVTESLRLGRSGITTNPTYAELGMRSQISGSIDLDLSEGIDEADSMEEGESEDEEPMEEELMNEDSNESESEELPVNDSDTEDVIVAPETESETEEEESLPDTLILPLEETDSGLNQGETLDAFDPEIANPM